METYIKELADYFRAAVEEFKTEIAGVRSGRPTTQLVENIQVEYAEGMYPIKQLGSLGIKPPREITITVWDQNAVTAVLKAIQDAKAGMSVQNEGNVVRCFLPPLSQERRDEFTKLVKKMSEGTRIRIRGNRDDVIKKIKAAEGAKELNEDQVFKGKERIQKLVNETNKQIETMVEGKVRELEE
ncbi:MAG: ribosome-recycling factor [Patescibacteria group bacterium]